MAAMPAEKHGPGQGATHSTWRILCRS